jgi:hypothetical protein
MTRWHGPHTVETQCAADRLTELCCGKRVAPIDVAAQIAATDVLDGRDAWPAAMVYDAVSRDDRWLTHELLTMARS